MPRKDTSNEPAIEESNNQQNLKKLGKNNNVKENKKLGFFKTMFIFLFALSIMIGVSLGTIYYILQNNVNNVAENNRPSLSKVPLIKYFLPEPKDKDILDSPDNYSDKDLRIKYTEIYKERNQLRKIISELTKNVSEKDKVAAENGQLKKETESAKASSESAKKDLEKEKAKLEEDRKKFAEMVAKQDKQGFKQYFESVDKETAQKVYAEAVKEEKADEGKKEISKIYDTMEPASSAKILEEMATTNKDLVINILKNMKKDTTSEVLAAMNAKTAAELSKQLESSYKPK